MIRRAVLRWAWRLMDSRPPDFVIGDDYLLRWYVIPRNPCFNVYLHEYHRSDDDRALHDHPWWSLSWLLNGRLVEHDGRGQRTMNAGKWRLRSARYSHRLEVPPFYRGDTVTLFLTGPRIRSWGFHCPQGWRHWRDFTAPSDSGQVGRGCD